MFPEGARLLRAIEPSAFETLEHFLPSRPARDFTEAGQLVTTRFTDPREFPSRVPADYHLAEHERIPFPSFPAEWPPEMLAAAGFLTLDLAEQSLSHGWRLKDASPYNVLFRGSSPVFVDVLSFERRDRQESLWPAYAQFVRTFLLPLLAEPAALSPLWLAHRDGLEPEQMYRSLSWSRRLTNPGLTLVTLPTWFAGRAESEEALYRPHRPIRSEPPTRLPRCSAVCDGNSRGSHPPRTASSHWSKYLATQSHYNGEQFAAKESFVASVLRGISAEPRARRRRQYRTLQPNSRPRPARAWSPSIPIRRRWAGCGGGLPKSASMYCLSWSTSAGPPQP